MKTVAFYAVFGVVPGYHHNNLVVGLDDSGLESLFSTVKPPVQIVSEIWQEAMMQEFDRSENLVAAVFHESRTVYPVGFGCPKGGETTVTVNGHINPRFIKYKGRDPVDGFLLAMYEYKEAVVRVCEAVKKELKQTTVSIAFYELKDFVYLTDKDKVND